MCEYHYKDADGKKWVSVSTYTQLVKLDVEILKYNTMTEVNQCEHTRARKLSKNGVRKY